MSWLGLSPAQALLLFVVSGLLIGALHWGTKPPASVAVPWLALWQGAATSRAMHGSKRLQAPLALLLALALLACLTLALGDLRLSQPRAPKQWLLLLDCSASMAVSDEQTTRFSLAKQLLKRVITTIPNEDSFVLIAIGDAPALIADSSDSSQSLASALAQAPIESGQANLATSVQAALQLANDEGPIELVLASDGNVVRTEEALALLKANKRIRARQLMVGKSTQNVAITRLSARNYPLQADQSALLVAIQNTGNAAQNVALAIEANGTPIHAEQHEVPADRSVTRVIPHVANLGGTISARLRATPSANLLTSDDLRQLTLPTRKRTRVLALSRGNRYLEAALLADELLDVHWAKDNENADASDYDVAILDGTLPDERLELPTLVLAPSPREEALHSAKAQVMRPFFDQWERDHPALRGLALADINITKASLVELQDTDKTIASTGRGEPLIVESKRAGKSLLALTFDARQSDLPLRSAWPLFILNAVHYLSGAPVDASVHVMRASARIAPRRVFAPLELHDHALAWQHRVRPYQVLLGIALIVSIAEWISALAFAASRRRSAFALALRAVGTTALVAALLSPNHTGVRASVRPNPPTHASEPVRSLRVTNLEMPTSVKVGAPFETTVHIHAPVARSATVRLTRDHMEVRRENVALQAGANHVRLQATATHAGDVLFRADVESEQPVTFERSTHALGKPRVLLIERETQHAEALRKLLEASQLEVDLRAPERAPRSSSELSDIAFYILSDVPRSQLPAGAEQAILAFMQAGGGFLMAGGERSLGAGGYLGSPLGAQLPVRLQRRDTHDEPSLALSLVIDKSGSMSDQKIVLAKEAARATAAALHDDDYLGVIGFDAAPTYVVRLSTVRNRAAIERGIERLQAGGGTAIFPALDAAYSDLSGVQARKKHVILLTDGQTREAGLDVLVENMQLSDITLSTIGLGKDVSRKLLEDLARIGRGRAYFTDDPKHVPRLFLHDTETVARPASVEQSVLAFVTTHADFLKGVELGSAPPLAGYVPTLPRPAPADTVLSTANGEPLLARMPVGAGWSLVFTPDLKARWSASWFAWRGFDRLLAQLIRAHMRHDLEQRSVEATVERGEATARVDLIDERGEFLTGLRGTISVHGMSRIGPALTADLTEIAPGRYEAALPVREPGSYALHAQLDTHRAFGSLVYSASDQRARLAPAAPVRDQRVSSARAEPLAISWWQLVWLAALFFVLDSFVRKLALPARRIGAIND